MEIRAECIASHIVAHGKPNMPLLASGKNRVLSPTARFAANVEF